MGSLFILNNCKQMKRYSTHLFWITAILLLNLSACKVYKVTGVTDDYALKYSKIAIREMKKYKIPASITLAQGILESARGTSFLAQTANNHFGIKCTTDWKGARAYKDAEIKNECFRKYKKAEESYKDHSLFLVNRSHYAKLFTLNIRDYKAWARGLKECGYATDPEYATKLIRVIEENRLYLFD